MRPQKITFGEMRSSGVRGVVVYCSDYRCSHSIAMPADQWPDDIRLSDIEPRFVCKACGSEVLMSGRTLPQARMGSSAN
jgi:DNA-directed RNA polymerase subunit RPC12/RpoP